ncbi:hypothetical protein EAI_07737 [Harpegnathos saltator]|uniref:Uncharacterized protein n=1 Tax=Harpegnathos saltator TaxID=610380 RepID=E2B522_HARSA|nr:hypothetical protein EAI_07737 [Harpegnathos saltator]
MKMDSGWITARKEEDYLNKIQKRAGPLIEINSSLKATGIWHEKDNSDETMLCDITQH